MNKKNSNINVNIEEVSTKKYHQFRKDRKNYLKHNLYLGAVIGFIATFTFNFVTSFCPYDIVLNFLVGILSCIIVSMLVFYWLEWDRVYEEKEREGETLSKAVENAIERFQAINPYSNILNNQLKLTWGLMGIFSQIVDETDEKGGIVISASSIEYMVYLENFLGKARISYKAILCGYDEKKDRCMYRPKWFFVEDDKIEEDVLVNEVTKKPMMPPGKIKWLKQILEKQELPIRVRIMILKQEEFVEDFLNEEIRKQFLEMHEKIELFFVIIDYIKINLKNRKVDWENIIEDYAIIDDSLVLKHDNDSSLLFASISSSIKPYREIFKLLDEDASLPNNSKYFKKLTKDGINDESWEAWENRIKNNNEHTFC